MSLSKHSSCELERRGDGNSLNKISSCESDTVAVLWGSMLRSKSSLLPV